MLKKLFWGEEGQGMVEYGLIIALISIAVVAVLPTVGNQLKAVFDKIKTELITPSGGVVG